MSERVALMLLCPDICQGDSRVFYAYDIFHIDRTHNAELSEHFRPDLNICPAVNKHERAFGAWHYRCKGGALYPAYPFDYHSSPERHSAAVSRADKGIALTLGKHFQSLCHRAFAFFPEHHARLIVHRYSAVRICYLKRRNIQRILLCAFLYPVLIPDKHDLRPRQFCP